MFFIISILIVGSCFDSVTVEAKFHNDSLGLSCVNDDSCLQYKAWCIDNQCRCQVGFEVIEQNNKILCQHFKCKGDEECQSFDRQRECVTHKGQCLCKADYQENWYNHLCEQADFDGRYLSVNYAWILVMITIPAVIIGLVCRYRFCQARSEGERSDEPRVYSAADPTTITPVDLPPPYERPEGNVIRVVPRYNTHLQQMQLIPVYHLETAHSEWPNVPAFKCAYPPEEKSVKF